MSQNRSAVPHLTTALTGPLQAIEQHFLDHQARIETWFRRAWRQTPAPFYASVDLRNAGFKLAPVDTNLFPAGFNNLNPAFHPLCILAVQSALERYCPEACGIVIVPEKHSRNLFYLEALGELQDIVQRAGYEVRIGSVAEEITQVTQMSLPSGRQLTLEPMQRDGNILMVGDFAPCVVLLNNDLSSGMPPILQDIDQPIIPPPTLGWNHRLKSEHFAEYRRVALEFAELIDLDPWLFDPMFRRCGEIDFMKQEGVGCVAENVDGLLQDIGRKYKEYGVTQEPFVIVKADAGTYGMGVMTVTDPAQVYELNRKQRTRMSTAKEGQAISKVIVQEGVYTFETWGDKQAVAEPVVYMIDHFVVGGFYRVHTGRGINENLNAPGMHFEPLSFVEPLNNPDQNLNPDADVNRFYAYGVVARLALLAAAREIAKANA
ncbi:MAG: glutamate--cysteine ligase [Gammaproteobacteria bacterium]|nr:glutamate--cysteine ligase [Gammaproteobacteria bacterium]